VIVGGEHDGGDVRSHLTSPVGVFLKGRADETNPERRVHTPRLEQFAGR
jgi:hypothetical protein